MKCSDWAGLPPHLLDLVVEKMESLKDYLRFGAVCPPWHCVMKDKQSTRKLLAQVPMLILPNKKENTFNLYDPVSDKFLESKLVIPFNKRFSGSSEGWLVTVKEDFTVTLYKPYSMVHENSTKIHLPCLFPPEMDEENPESFREFVQDCGYHVFKAAITADPLTNPDDCMVVVIFRYSLELAFIRPAIDSKWTKVDLDQRGIFDILFHNNKLYVLKLEDELLSYDILGPSKSHVTLIEHTDHRDGYVKPYLVTSSEGDILQVKRYLKRDKKTATIRVTTRFRVFKLAKLTWVEITSLGDGAMFLGDNSSVYVRASNFVGCKSNCIYFSHDFDVVVTRGPPDNSHCDSGVFNLGDKSFENFKFSYEELSSLTLQPPIWVVPTLSMY